VFVKEVPLKGAGPKEETEETAAPMQVVEAV
jgi:hypothetical protein